MTLRAAVLLSGSGTTFDHAAGERAAGRLDVDFAVVVDPQPGHGILAEAETCDLIAMATRGRSGVRRAVLGSAADKVLRGAKVPVLLHRADA